MKPVAHDQLIFDYLAHGRVDHVSKTFFSGIFRLPPAHYLDLSVNVDTLTPTPRCYWDLEPTDCITDKSDEEHARRLRELIEDSIRLQLRSDVPIGTCLSGGLESSTIVCLVHRMLREHAIEVGHIGNRQRTFSCYFDDPRFDERNYIQLVLAQTGADADFISTSVEQLIAEMPEVTWHQDEPFGGTSVYAQWTVFRRVAECGVRVTLDGQGGDELFAGYIDYSAPFMIDLLTHGRLLQFIEEWRNHSIGPRPSAYHLLSLATAAWMSAPRTALRHATSSIAPDRYPWIARDFTRAYAQPDNWAVRKYPDLLREQLYRELKGGLPLLLRHEDRNSMAFSVEARVPFLDHRIVEHAFMLPAHQRIRHGVTKYAMRQAVEGIVPGPILKRRDKMGFVTPQQAWMQGKLGQHLAERLADAPDPIMTYLERSEVDRLLRNLQQGQATPGVANLLWRVLSACVWFDRFKVRRATLERTPTRFMR